MATSTSPTVATTRFGSSLGVEKTWATLPPPGLSHPLALPSAPNQRRMTRTATTMKTTTTTKTAESRRVPTTAVLANGSYRTTTHAVPRHALERSKEMRQMHLAHLPTASWLYGAACA